jgi:hypothetical protein
MVYFDFLSGVADKLAMKRYKLLVNSACLSCRKWLCVMAGTYTGEIQCRNCGIVNVFQDSSKPCETKPYEGEQAKIRRRAGCAA